MAEDEFRYRAIENHILALVDGEQLKPGERLPSLRNLSRQMQASVSTVSQAYLELEKKGLIEARERSGFYLKVGSGRLPPPPSRPRPALVPTYSQRSGLIQTVLKALGNRNLLPFGVVCPAAELLPAKALARSLAEALRVKGASALDYTPVTGDTGLRRQIALRTLEAGVQVSPDEVLVTSGAMEGLAIALRALTRPGDNVLIQSPSYFCFLQLLENCGLRGIEIPSSTSGIDPQDLLHAVERYDVKAAILVPNFNNPDGSLTCDEAKGEIVEILAEHHIPLVEDDVYGDLHFAQHRPKTCKSFDRQGNVILCSSFSKTIAPGYRVGWMLPGRHLGKALEIKTSTTICTASPTQLAIAAYLRDGHYERHLNRLRKALRGQMEALLPSLRQHFPPGTRAGFPEGGASIWVELPVEVDSVDYFYQARQLGIGLAPGPIFSTQDKYNNFIRLSCNGVWNHTMSEGIAALGRLAWEMADTKKG